MKLRRSTRKTHALTLIDVVIVIAVLALFLAMMDFGPPTNAKRKAQQISCLNNLKQDALAVKLWSGYGHRDCYPMRTPVINGGTMEFMNSSEAWRTFQVMSNELGTPKLLYCPADEARTPATNFDDSLQHHISYFVNWDATDTDPQSILFGDSSFEFHKTSVTPGFFDLASNNPPQWSSLRHPRRGNFAFADGSVQNVTDKSLIPYLTATGLATNRIFIP